MPTLSATYTSSTGKSGTATLTYSTTSRAMDFCFSASTFQTTSSLTGAEYARAIFDGTTICSGYGGNQTSTSSPIKTIWVDRGKTTVSKTLKVEWYKTVNGTTTVLKTATASISIPVRDSYNVTYNANGGTNAPATQKKYYGLTLTLTSSVPTRTGYTFRYWKTQADGSGTTYNPGGSYSTDSALALYAQWLANTWYVKYNGNGATSGSMSNSTHTYNTAKNLTANAFARAYTVTYNHNYSGSSNATATATYTFSKWNTKSDGTGTDYANQASVKNLTSTAGGTVNIYARWTSASVSLRTPTRTGYTFGGWYKETACTNKVGNAGASYTPTANITLYAKWTINTYTISFNANGGSGAPASQKKTYNQALTLSSTKPTRTDCKFLGWATSSTATTATYQPGGTLPASVNTATTLYAVWESVPKITSLTAIRCDSEGTQDDEGTYAKVTAVWSVNSAVNSATSGTAKLYNGTTEVTSGKTGTWSGSSGGTATAIVSGMSTDNQYTLKVEVTNGGSKASRTVLLTRAFFTMDFKNGGNGVGIFSAAPSDGLIVGKPTAIYGNTSVRGTLAAYASNIDMDGTLPSSATYSSEKIIMRDVDGEPLFYLDSVEQTSGGINSRIVVANEYGGDQYTTSLWIAKPKTDSNNDGAMTFLGNTFAIRAPHIDRDGALPSEAQWGPYIYFQDKDSETLGYIQTYRDTSGLSGIRIYGSNEYNGSGVSNGLTLFVRADGTRGVTFSETAPWRSALGLGTSGALPITVGQGGTGATSAANARTNLEAAGTGDANVFTKTQYVKFSNINRDGTAPSSDAWGTPLIARDKDGEEVARFISVQRTDGRVDAGIIAVNEKSDGTEVTNSLYARVAKDGTLSYYVNSPLAFRNALALNTWTTVAVGDFITFTSGAGWSSTSTTIRYNAALGIVRIYANWKTSSAKTAGNYTIGTVASTYRPKTMPVSVPTLTSAAQNAYIDTGGAFKSNLSAISANGTVFFVGEYHIGA